MFSKVPVQINPYDCAKRGVIFEGTILVSQFKRLLSVGRAVNADSTFDVVLHFDVDAAWDSRLTGSIVGIVVLECQRCLHDMEFGINISLNHVLCPDERKLEKHKNSEVIFSEDDGKVRMVDLLEDEILLEIPIIGKHENIEDCQGLDQYLEGNEEKNEIVESVPNPFSILKDKLH
jgi:uncharacterized protein